MSIFCLLSNLRSLRYRTADKIIGALAVFSKMRLAEHSRLPVDIAAGGNVELEKSPSI